MSRGTPPPRAHTWPAALTRTARRKGGRPVHGVRPTGGRTMCGRRVVSLVAGPAGDGHVWPGDDGLCATCEAAMLMRLPGVQRRPRPDLRALRNEAKRRFGRRASVRRFPSGLCQVRMNREGACSYDVLGSGPTWEAAFRQAAQADL